MLIYILLVGAILNDIGLIQLNCYIDYKSGVLPVLLPVSSEDQQMRQRDGEIFYAAGWGKTNTCKFNKQLP